MNKATVTNTCRFCAQSIRSLSADADQAASVAAGFTQKQIFICVNPGILSINGSRRMGLIVMPIRSEYYVLLKCGCIETTLGMVKTLGEKTWEQSCNQHLVHSPIVKTYKSGIELWRDLERQRTNPTLF